MNKLICAGILLIVSLPTGASAQIVTSGQMGVDFYRSAPTTSQRSVNSGRPSFGFEGDFFLDGFVNDNVVGLVNARVTETGYLSFDYLAIRLSDLTPLGLTVQVGKFDLPFGNLGERRYPRRNLLFGLPVIYDYRMSLPDHVPTEAEILSHRGAGAGMRLLDGGMYDLGAMVSGSAGIVDYALAVTSGTVSATTYGGGNTNSDVGKILRLAVTPFTGLTVGGAYAWGAYLEEYSTAPTRPVDVNTYNQRAAEVDVEFSRGHLVTYAEGVTSTWAVPLDTRDEQLKALGYSMEAKYTIIPRLHAALRLSGLHFGSALLGGTEQPWDYDVTEWEGGVGYFLDRDVLLKLVRRETRIHGGSFPKDNLTVLQLAIAF